MQVLVLRNIFSTIIVLSQNLPDNIPQVTSIAIKTSLHLLQSIFCRPSEEVAPELSSCLLVKQLEGSISLLNDGELADKCRYLSSNFFPICGSTAGLFPRRHKSLREIVRLQ